MKNKALVLSCLTFIMFNCKDNMLTVKNDAPPEPPAQISMWDLVGIAGEHNITSIKVVPDQPWVIYVGIMSNFSDGTLGKVLKSTDWGKTWKVSLESVSVSGIVIDPKNNDIVYAGLNANNGSVPGVIKTIDAGMTWSRSDSGVQLSGEEWVDVIINDPMNSNVLYAGVVGVFGGGLIKTT